MTPPASLVTALRQYDKALRCRWAAIAEEWWIEQPLPKADPELCRTLASQYLGQLDLALPSAERKALSRRVEAVKAAQDGYRGIMFIPPDLVDRTELVMKTLHESDIRQQGGWQGINRRQDTIGEKFYTDHDKAVRRFAEDGARDLYDRLAWLEGRRLTTSDMTEGAETSDGVESHEGFTVRIRKGQHAEVGL